MKSRLLLCLTVLVLTIGLACSDSAQPSDRNDSSQVSSDVGQFELLLEGLADARSMHIAELLPDGRVILIGGRSKGVSEWPIVHSRVEIFDPVTQEWTVTGELVDERQLPAVIVFSDGKVLVAGGTDSSINPYNRAEIWNPQTGQWTSAGKMKKRREIPQGIDLDDGRGLVAGGISKLFKHMTNVEAYDPVTDEWMELASTNEGRARFTLTKLQDGKILAVGGGALEGPWKNSAEVYDPAADTWTLTADLITGRAMHTATLLEDGRVLVVGGMGQGSGQGVSLTSAEIYNPVTNEWSTAGNTQIARQDHVATLMKDGRVIVVGGVGGTLQSEIYDPVDGTWLLGPMTVEGRYRFAGVTLADGSILIIAGQSTTKVLHTSEIYKPQLK